MSKRVRATIARWVESGRNVYVAKEPPFDAEDGGVPPSMWDGEPDASGWVRWVPVASAVTERDVAALEARAGVTLPPLVREWLVTASLGPLETSALRLPALWADAPLRDLTASLDAWAPLERAGYLAIGDDADDRGPLCLDLRSRDDAGEAPVVAFSQDALLALGAQACADRAQVAPLATLRFASFGALLDALDRSAQEESV